MQKLITLRFQSKCRKCGDTLAAGSRALWLGKGRGVSHELCPRSSEPEKAKQGREGAHDYTIDYSELRELFPKFVENPMNVYRRPQNEARGKSLVEDWKMGDWAGCSIPEMRQFIDEGYRVDGLDNVTSLIPARPRRKIRYSDEGDEMLLDLAWAGSDTPFMEWEKRVAKPGLSVEIHMTFSAIVSSRLITAYQRWIARALQTLDESGNDLEVSLVINGTGTFVESRQASALKVRVRNAGEASDFANWSAMFSPGGFRMLGIMAIGIHADRAGYTINHGYGQSDPYGEWTVAYDDGRNVIVIGNKDDYDSRAEFPEMEMTEKLRNVLAKLSG